MTKKCILHLKLKARHGNFFDKGWSASKRISLCRNTELYVKA